jgi:hypothetical protein
METDRIKQKKKKDWLGRTICAVRTHQTKRYSLPARESYRYFEWNRRSTDEYRKVDRLSYASYHHTCTQTPDHTVIDPDLDPPSRRAVWLAQTNSTYYSSSNSLPLRVGYRYVAYRHVGYTPVGY